MTVFALGSPAQEDLADVVDLVERIHPNPTRYSSAEVWNDTVAREHARLARSTDPRELTESISRLLATLGDGHVEVGLPQALVADPELFPLQLVWLNNRAWVAGAKDPALVGRELAQIAGKPADVLHEELLALVSVDGKQRGAAEAALRFDPWRHLHLVLAQEPTYTVVFADGEVLTLEAATRQQVGALQGNNRFSPSSNEVTMEVRGGVAWWALPSFGDPDAARVDAAVEAVFAQDLPEHLVLDLRGNVGGFRLHGAGIVAHLVDAPFSQFDAASLELRPLPKRLRKHLSVPYGLPSEETLRLLRTGASERIDSDPLAELLVPRLPRYDGEVVVLVDGVTESAAVELVVALKAARPDVLVVGEPTAGACDRHNGQRPVLFVTPRFEVPVLMSLVAIDLVDTPGCVPGSGLTPDVSLHWTLDSLRDESDPWAQWVEQWVRSAD